MHQLEPDFERIYESVGDVAPRSRLEPYRDVILRWRRKRPPFSYRRILRALATEGVTVTVRTLYEFVQRRSRPRPDGVVELPPPNQTEPMATGGEIVVPRRTRAEMVAQREAIRAVHAKSALPDE
jgi:hypothetical protein